MSIFKFELGIELVDQITGFSGIVMTRADWLSSSNGYGLISRELENGKPKDQVDFDEIRLRYKDPTKTNSMLDVIGSKFKFELGDLVKDKASKYVGVIVGRVQWATGCNIYLVKSQKLENNKIITEYLSERSLTLIKNNKVNYSEKENVEKIPGGPIPTMSIKGH